MHLAEKYYWNTEQTFWLKMNNNVFSLSIHNIALSVFTFLLFKLCNLWNFKNRKLLCIFWRNFLHFKGFTYNWIDNEWNSFLNLKDKKIALFLWIFFFIFIIPFFGKVCFTIPSCTIQNKNFLLFFLLMFYFLSLHHFPYDLLCIFLSIFLSFCWQTP